jgi:hypothetical protein
VGRDHHRPAALARCQRPLFDPADHRRPVADDPARRAVDGPEHLVDDGAVRRPRPAAPRHRGGPGPGRARLLPAVEHVATAPRPARDRPVPGEAGPGRPGAHRPVHRDPGARAVLRGAGARHHGRGRPRRAELVLVDGPGPAAVRDPLGPAGRGDRDRVPLRPSRRPRVGPLADDPVDRSAARQLPPVPGVRGVHRERGDGRRVRLDLHEVGPAPAARHHARPARRGGLRRVPLGGSSRTRRWPFSASRAHPQPPHSAPRGNHRRAALP